MGISASRVASMLRTKLINTTAAAVLVISSVGFAIPLLSTNSAFAATPDVCASGCAHNTIQAAIDAATAGSTINVGAGVYSANEFRVLNGKEITIEGAGIGNTTMKLTAVTDGFKVQANNVTLKNFTIDGSGIATYGLRAQNVTGLSVQNIYITGMTRSGFDINGVKSSHFTNITALNNGGVGVSVTDSTDLTFANVTTSGNLWGGIGLYTKGGNYPGMCGVNNIVFGGAASLAETVSLYTGINNVACPVANITPPASLTHKITSNNLAAQNIYTKSITDASALANPAFSPVISSTATGDYIVSPDLKIQHAINAATTGSIINVLPGTYNENVNVNKAVSILGTNPTTTRIVGVSGTSNAVTFSTNNATVSGFTITHEYTVSELAAWNDASINNAGVTFDQGTTGNTLSNSVVTLNRNGVYLNNSQGNKVINNTITNNRTGINLTNNVSNTVITGNTISDNWTLGLVYYWQTPSAGTDFNTLNVSGNTFSNNWYSEVVVKNAGPSTGTLNLQNNTFSDNPITYSTSSDSSLNEPGFAAQKPVTVGGSATAPTNSYPTIRIYNSGAATIAYTPTPTPPVTPPTTPTNPSTGGTTPAATNAAAPATATTTYIAYYDGNGDGVAYEDGEVAVTNENTANEGEVKGESTKKGNTATDDPSKNPDTENSSAFLGLGWWWIPVIIAGLGIIYWVVVKRADTTSSSS